MRVQVKSSRGHFDWAHPQDESVSTSISVMDDGGMAIHSVVITTDDLVGDNDPVTLADEITIFCQRCWFSDRDKALALAVFLRKNYDALVLGNTKYEIEQLVKKRAELTVRIKKLIEQCAKMEVDAKHVGSE